MTASTRPKVLLALALAAVVAVVVLVSSTYVRTTRAIEAAAPPDPSGSGTIEAWARSDPASHAYDDMHGLASGVGPSRRPPRFARRLDGVVFQLGRTLIGDTLVAGVFEPAPGAGGQIGAFRVAAIDLRNAKPAWRSPPSYSSLVPLRVADGSVTVLANARHREPELRRLAIRAAAARKRLDTFDPVTYVLKRLDKRMAQTDPHALKRIIRLIDRGEDGSVDVGAEHISGLAWSEDIFASAGTSDVTLTTLSDLKSRVVTSCLVSAQMSDISVRPGNVLVSWCVTGGSTTATTSWPGTTEPASGTIRLGATALDTRKGSAAWHQEWGFPSVALVSDAAAARASDRVVLHITEGTTQSPGGMMAYSAATGRRLWSRPLARPAGQELFGDRAFSRRREEGGKLSWLFCTATRPSALSTDPAAETGLFIVDLVRGTGRYLSRPSLGLDAEHAVHVLWSGEDLMVLQAGEKPQLLLVSSSGHVRWRVVLPGPLEDKRLGLMANDSWIVAGSLVLER